MSDDLKRKKSDYLLELAIEEQLDNDGEMQAYQSGHERPHEFSDEHNRKLTDIYNRAERSNPEFQGGVPAGKSGDLSSVRRDRKREDGSLHGDDPKRCTKRQSGDCPDPGDRIDIPDGHAFCAGIWKPGVHYEFQTVCRGTL